MDEVNFAEIPDGGFYEVKYFRMSGEDWEKSQAQSPVTKEQIKEAVRKYETVDLLGVLETSHRKYKMSLVGVDDGEIVEGVKTSTHYWKRVLRAHKPRFGQDFNQVVELLLTKINLKSRPTNTALYANVRSMLLNVHSIRKACNYTFDPEKCSKLKLPTYAQLEALRIYGDNNSGFGNLPRGIEDLLRATALGWRFRPRNPGHFPKFWLDFVRHDEQVFRNQKRQQEAQGGRASQKVMRVDAETEELRTQEPETGEAATGEAGAGEAGATVMPKQSAEVSSEIHESEAWKKAVTESIRAVDFKQIREESLKEAFGSESFKRNQQEAWERFMDSERFKQKQQEALERVLGSEGFKQKQEEAWERFMDSEGFKQKQQEAWERFMDSERFMQKQQEAWERFMDSEGFKQKQQEAWEHFMDSERFKQKQEEALERVLDSERFKQKQQEAWERFMDSERFKQKQQEALERVLGSEGFKQNLQEALEKVLDSPRLKKTQNEVEAWKDSERPSPSQAALGQMPRESRSKWTDSSDDGASSIGGTGSQKTPLSNYKKSYFTMGPDSDSDEEEG
ncbi:hypothetical protein K445DRAFT_377677 [Daldinia sp. EC12]|nr:hypothetical protein K445DRAFT_377677 [Daldinia sp. EC12]